MDFPIGCTDLHDMGLLRLLPLENDNEKIGRFYETWYQRSSPIDNLTFVLTDQHLYLRPEEEQVFVPDGINSVGDYSSRWVGVVCLSVCLSVCPLFFSLFTMG